MLYYKLQSKAVYSNILNKLQLAEVKTIGQQTHPLRDGGDNTNDTFMTNCFIEAANQERLDWCPHVTSLITKQQIGSENIHSAPTISTMV